MQHELEHRVGQCERCVPNLRHAPSTPFKCWGDPRQAKLPLCIIPTRLHSASTSSMLWLVKTTDTYQKAGRFRKCTSGANTQLEYVIKTSTFGRSWCLEHTLAEAFSAVLASSSKTPSCTSLEVAATIAFQIALLAPGSIPELGSAHCSDYNCLEGVARHACYQHNARLFVHMCKHV